MTAALPGLGRYVQPALLILVSLADGAKHGYAIMEDLVNQFGVRLGAGTLYAALARLERRGLIEPLPSEDRRRPYRLTEAGTVALRRQLDSLQEVAAVGLRRLAST